MVKKKKRSRKRKPPDLSRVQDFNNLPPSLTRPEAAHIGGWSEATQDRHIADGKIEAVRIGGMVRIKTASLLRLLDQGDEAAKETKSRRSSSETRATS